LLTFLHGAGLIATKNPAVALTGGNLQGAFLQGADLIRANLQEAKVTDAQLADAQSLQGATMPDGQILKSDDNPDGPSFEEWLKDKEGSGKDVQNE
jgi:uncharacterized protein YjbI with pentapeptide repeats